jgi:uncharacterized MnhB-related membrane protein
MTVLQAVILSLVALGGTAVVLTRDPLRQAMVAAIYGLLLATLFFAFQAPDPGLSAIVVGTIALPIMLLLAITRVREGGE